MIQRISNKGNLRRTIFSLEVLSEYPLGDISIEEALEKVDCGELLGKKLSPKSKRFNRPSFFGFSKPNNVNEDYDDDYEYEIYEDNDRPETAKNYGAETCWHEDEFGYCDENCNNPEEESYSQGILR